MIDLELLRSCGIIKNFQADTVITTEGELGQDMFFILSGKVGVYLNTFSDNAVKVAELGPGETFGEMSVLEDLPRSATIVSLESVNVLEIDKNHFELFLSQQPEMAFKLMKSLSGRLRNTNKALIDVGNNSKTLPNPNIIHTSYSAENSSQISSISVSEQNFSIRGLFPPEHKKYDLVPEYDSSEYIFEKLVPCPICGAKFMTIGQRMSKLRSKGMDPDLRRRYENFDPLWYNIWTCPECYYSNYYHEFPSIPASKHKLITDKIKSILNGQKISIVKNGGINQLFTQYYLLLNCTIATSAPNIKLGKIWMNMMWLYRDCGDAEMVKISSESALKYYLDAYMKSDTDLKSEDEQQLCIILGSLYAENDKMDEAFKYLMKARSQRGGNKTFSQMAELRLDELKNSKDQ
jgi:CRP-like cAMP-binding protein/uncharacterized protein (DUF2225 family)